MPHIIIEYSANLADLNPQKVAQCAHQIVVESAVATTADIKTRIYKAENFIIGAGDPNTSFIHVTLRFIEDRTLEVQQNITNTLQTTLRKLVPQANSISVDYREITKATYAKTIAP